MRLIQPLGLYLEEEQWQEVGIQVAGGRPLEAEDKHLVQLRIASTPPQTDEVVREGEEGEMSRFWIRKYHPSLPQR